MILTKIYFFEFVILSVFIFWANFSFIFCRGSNYSLLKHNCNTFSEDLCQFLCGSSIPKYILDLPQEFLSTPLGQSLGPLIGKVFFILFSCCFMLWVAMKPSLIYVLMTQLCFRLISYRKSRNTSRRQFKFLI